MKLFLKTVAPIAMVVGVSACSGGLTVECETGACNLDGNGTTTDGGTISGTGTINTSGINLGGGGATVYEPPSETNYRTFANAADGYSQIRGSVVRSNSSNQQMTVNTVTGHFFHHTAGALVSDEQYAMYDSDGPQSDGELIGDGATVQMLDNRNFRVDKTAAYIRSEYVKSGVAYSSDGVIGMITHIDDMPNADTVEYAGSMRGMVITAGQGVNITDGSSKVTVNFGAGDVDVDLTNFTAVDMVTGETAVTVVDQIKVDNLTISQNGYSGGAMTLLNNGATVNVTGANTQSASQGNFFGYDKYTGKPDSVGGASVIKGDTGIVTTTYIAE